MVQLFLRVRKNMLIKSLAMLEKHKCLQPQWGALLPALHLPLTQSREALPSQPPLPYTLRASRVLGAVRCWALLWRSVELSEHIKC